MAHDLATGNISYVVACNDTHSRRSDIIRRLSDSFCTPCTPDSHDPFMLHSLITHETFLDARTVINPLRYQLYDQLDRVDDYSEKSAFTRKKGDLEDLTIQLHVISQELDQMTAGAEMTSMIIRRLTNAHNRYRTCVNGHALQNAIAKTSDGLEYLKESVDAQKRWLISYKSRKDIAMNLVGPFLLYDT